MRNNLYVPKINETRLISVEKWFSSQETQLSKFLNKLDLLKYEPISYDLKNFSLSVQALIGLEYRSRFLIYKIHEFLKNNPTILKQISYDINLSIDKLVLEKLIKKITDETHRIMPAQLIVNKTVSNEFILCDRPVIDLDDSKCYIVGRRKLINIQKSDERNSNIRFGSEDAKFVDIFNHQLALQARDWILSSNELLLNRYIELINSNEYKESLKKDRIEIVRAKHLTTEYEIID